jgi:two-component system chemotaxis response regulator CheY
MHQPLLDSFRILIVDDESTIRKLVRNVLTSLGFSNVTEANSGRRAIEILASDTFDFIITDWRMDDMDGIEIVRHARALPSNTPIIMLTGNTEAYYVKTAINAGINGYLIKPFSAEQLVKRIRSAIDAPRDFVVSKKYTGPDRRHMNQPGPDSVDRRKPKNKQSNTPGYGNVKRDKFA